MKQTKQTLLDLLKRVDDALNYGVEHDAEDFEELRLEVANALYWLERDGLEAGQ